MQYINKLEINYNPQHYKIYFQGMHVHIMLSIKATHAFDVQKDLADN